MANITLLPSAKVPLIYPDTSTMTTEWYRFFWNVYGFTGDPSGAIPVNKGGTGLTAIGEHEVIIGTANNTFEPAIFTGSGIAITYAPGIINLAIGASGITPGTYGLANSVGQFTVNEFGILTYAADVLIGIDATQIISGTINSARISGSYTGITGVGTLTVGTWNANTIAANYGGTGQSSYTIGDLLYADSASSLAKLADVATGNALLSGGVGAAPSWGKIDLTTHVTGVLPVANGGTGQSSFTNGQLLIGNTTGNTLTKATLTAGSGVTITNGAGSITISATGTGGTVTSVSGTSPISVATGTTTPVISISQATTSTNGYLSSTDWNTFNNKQPAGSYLTAVSVVSANGFAGSSSGGTTPALTLSTTITGLLKGNGTAISAASSGTDYAPATSGTSILYGNGAGGFSNVTIGTGVSFVGGTLSATGSGGTVTSVTGTAPVSVATGTTTPVISLASGYGDTQNPYASKTANYFLAAPNGSAGLPTFRAIVATDIPALSYVTSVSGTGSVNGITLTGTVTSSGSLTLGGTLSGIANSQLTNSTISGVALGGNLFNLTAGTGITFSSGTTYNGSAAITINATNVGTVTSVAAITLGTTGTDLSSTVANSTTTPVITLNVPTASATNRGALSSTDWSTFNSKAPGVTFTSNYIPFGQGTTTLNQSSALQFDGTNFSTTGTAKAAGVWSTQTIYATGSSAPASAGGPALLGGYSSGGTAAFIQGYNYTTSAFVDLLVIGTNIKFGSGSSGNEYMRLASNGALLIGTTSQLTSHLISASVSSGQLWGFGPYTGAGSNFYVSYNGNTGVYLVGGGTSWTANSDARLKNITGTYVNPLADIAQIQAVKFTWKADSANTPQVGVIAQSVESVVPEAISRTPSIDGDDTKYLGVRYTELIPLMIASIQQLSLQVKELQAEIERK